MTAPKKKNNNNNNKQINKKIDPIGWMEKTIVLHVRETF